MPQDINADRTLWWTIDGKDRTNGTEIYGLYHGTTRVASDLKGFREAIRWPGKKDIDYDYFRPANGDGLSPPKTNK